MASSAPRTYWDHAGLAALLAGFFAGPVVWGVTLQTNYSLVKWACLGGRPLMLSLFSLIALGLVGGGFWLSWRAWQQLRAHADVKGGTLADRSYFLAVSGMWLNALFALLILTSSALPFIVNPCQ
jgi:hypothetical protein